MKARTQIFFTVLLLLFSGILPGGEIVIVCTGDLHGEGEKFSCLATEIRRRKPDILLDAGDLFSGNFSGSADGGAAMMCALEALKYDVFVPGNHDFDRGLDHLGKLLTSFHGAALGEWQSSAVPMLKKWVMLERNGLRIAVIGLGNPEEKSRLLPDADFAAIPHDEALESSLTEAKKAGAHLVVAVFHRGLYHKDGSLGDLLFRHPGIDIVFGSHTHQAVRGVALADSFYIQPGAHAASAACAVVTFDDRDQRIVQIESALLTPAGNAADPALARIFSGQQERIAAWGDVPAPGFTEKLALPLPGKFDCGFARFAAEAIREAVRSDAAVFDGYAAEREIFPPVTRRKIFALNPFDGTVIVAEMTRGELRGVMEEMLGAVKPRSCGVVPGFAGIVYEAQKKKLISLDMPEKVTVALGSFRFCRSSALADLRNDPHRWRDSGIRENDAVWEKILREGAK